MNKSYQLREITDVLKMQINKDNLTWIFVEHV